MNKYLLILFATSSILLFGCKKFLTETAPDQLTEREALSSPKLVYLNLVANIYTQIGADGGGNGIGGTDRGLYDLQTFTSDEAILPKRGGDWADGGLWEQLFKNEIDPANGLLKATWDYLYRVVGKCNQSIDKLQELQQQSPDNKDYPVYIAEIKALRAMYYYYLLDMFARVPLVTSSTIAMADVKQSSRSEVFKFVVKEFQESYPLLSTAKSNIPGEYYGRMTRPVAFMFLAKLALNAQVYSDDDWTDAGSPNGSTDFPRATTCWQATIDYCDSISKYGYSLATDYASNFSTTNENSVENIFTIPMDPILYKSRMMYLVRSRHYDVGKAYKQDGWNGASLTKQGLQIFGYYTTTPDPRLALCFYTDKVQGPDGSDVINSLTGQPLQYKPDAVAIDVSNTTYEKTAGARWAKYETDKAAQAGGQLVTNDYVIFRYADVLLMKAEALLRNNASGADVLVNEVRDRVGATPITTGFGLQSIIDERMLELSWEGVRRQDLIRFGQYTTATRDRTTTLSHSKTVFLIPADVLLVNPNLTQNPNN